MSGICFYYFRTNEIENAQNQEDERYYGKQICTTICRVLIFSSLNMISLLCQNRFQTIGPDTDSVPIAIIARLVSSNGAHHQPIDQR